MKGDKVDDASSRFIFPSPAPTDSPKKEKHPPEKISDYDFQSVEGFLDENHETDAPNKEESSPGEPKDEHHAFQEPVVISTSITTTHVKDLHELCQSHIRLTPFFVFEQRKPQEFSVVLKLVGPEGTKDIPVEGTYPSKRHAKEAASGHGIEYVKNLPRGESLKSISLETLEKEDENWVGLLSGEDSPFCFSISPLNILRPPIPLSFKRLPALSNSKIKGLFLSLDKCNIKKIRPQYTDYATPGSGFSCEVRLGVELGYPGIEEEVFGDKHRAFKNKRSAKIAAAKAAMLWIRGQSRPSSPVGSGAGSSRRPGRSTAGKDLIYRSGATPAEIVNRNHTLIFDSFPPSPFPALMSTMRIC